MPKGSALLPKQAVLVPPLWYLLIMLQSYLLQQDGLWLTFLLNACEGKEPVMVKHRRDQRQWHFLRADNLY
jgi:hypothetical protein